MVEGKKDDIVYKDVVLVLIDLAGCGLYPTRHYFPELFGRKEEGIVVSTLPPLLSGDIVYMNSPPSCLVMLFTWVHSSHLLMH